MMSLDLARALDPALLAQECGLTLDLWQADLLRKSPRRALLNCCRQGGKTEAASQSTLHTALMTSSALCIVVSPSQRQSAEFFRRCMASYRMLKGVPGLRAESVLRAEFENDSRIIALPGSEATVRGYAAADLVVIDEAARVEDELLAAVRPMLATSNGRLIALSTPAGKRGWFYEAWIGDDSWHRVRVPASECPRISKEFLAEELRELGQQRFSEEYELAFVDANEAVFGSAIIEAAFSQEVSPLW
jgi:hypothetical protein